jgi:hypothetical protein
VQWGLASLKKEGKWGGRDKAGWSGGPHLLKRRWGEVGEGGRGGVGAGGEGCHAAARDGRWPRPDRQAGAQSVPR